MQDERDTWHAPPAHTRQLYRTVNDPDDAAGNPPLFIDKTRPALTGQG